MKHNALRYVWTHDGADVGIGVTGGNVACELVATYQHFGQTYCPHCV